MPKKKSENELTPEEQFKRFREKAKEIGIDEKEKPLEKAFKKMAQKAAKRTSQQNSG